MRRCASRSPKITYSLTHSLTTSIQEMLAHLKNTQENAKEVYYLENISKEKAEELCDLRQPAVFNYENQPIRDSILAELQDKKNYSTNVIIRNSKNIENYVPISLDKTLTLFQKDDQSTYYSENNTAFISETGIKHILDSNDYYLKPCMMASKSYDIMFGSENSHSPLRYDINYRNFYYCVKGSVKIKLAPPKSSEYLRETKNYNTFEFSSPVNLWEVQDEYMFDMRNVDTLDVSIREGQVLYIPAFWWYTIEFQKEAIISSLKYRTYMNALAVLPRFILRFFQMQNVSHKMFPTKEAGAAPAEPGAAPAEPGAAPAPAEPGAAPAPAEPGAASYKNVAGILNLENKPYKRTKRKPELTVHSDNKKSLNE